MDILNYLEAIATYVIFFFGIVVVVSGGIIAVKKIWQ